MKRFYTGEPCKNGHFSERYTLGGHCIACLERTHALWKERLGSDGLRAVQKLYDARFAEIHPERKYESSRQAKQRLRARDPGHETRYNNEWRKKNPEAVRAMRQRHVLKVKTEQPEIWKIRTAALRAAFRAKSVGTLSPKGLSIIVRRVWERSHGRCAACASEGRLELDHITAIANGGGNDEANLQFLCVPCNRSKGTKDHAEWLQQHSEMELAA